MRSIYFILARAALYVEDHQGILYTPPRCFQARCYHPPAAQTFDNRANPVHTTIEN